MAAPRQPLRPRNVEDAARPPLKPRGVDDEPVKPRVATTPQKLRDADGARHETDERLPRKKVRLLPKKRIRMLPARDEKWTAPLHSPERDRPPDLEASMDGSIVMALATPTTAGPEVVEAPTEPPPASMGARREARVPRRARESSEEALRRGHSTCFRPLQPDVARLRREWSGAARKARRRSIRGRG